MLFYITLVGLIGVLSVLGAVVWRSLEPPRIPKRIEDEPDEPDAIERALELEMNDVA